MSNELQPSVRGQLNMSELKKILKTFLWSATSGLITFVILTLPGINVPPEYAALAAAMFPSVNTFLVATKKFADGQTKE